jgi:ribosome-associated protein
VAELRITDEVSIDESELAFSFARSGGPGGQHVNTSSTKVELRFDVESSPSLTAEQKAAIRKTLDSRITADGVLVLTSSEHRSQTRNREAAVARFQALLADAVRPRKPRKRTRKPKAADRRRLEEKRQQSEKKQLRKPPDV